MATRAIAWARIGPGSVGFEVVKPSAMGFSIIGITIGMLSVLVIYIFYDIWLWYTHLNNMGAGTSI